METERRREWDRCWRHALPPYRREPFPENLPADSRSQVGRVHRAWNLV